MHCIRWGTRVRWMCDAQTGKGGEGAKYFMPCRKHRPKKGKVHNVPMGCSFLSTQLGVRTAWGGLDSMVRVHVPCMCKAHGARVQRRTGGPSKTSSIEIVKPILKGRESRAIYTSVNPQWCRILGVKTHLGCSSLSPLSGSPPARGAADEMQQTV